ncbi:hypothetical protein ACWEKM_44970 [Streptomyces sp. NPDC004752]
MPTPASGRVRVNGMAYSSSYATTAPRLNLYRLAASSAAASGSYGYRMRPASHRAPRGLTNGFAAHG